MIFRATVVILLVTANLTAAKWTRATSQNFEVYTEGGGNSAKDLLSRFETMRSIFLTRSYGVVTSPIPVRIFVFTDPKEYLRYAPKNSGGYYQPYPERDLIALNGVSINDYGPAMRNLVYATLRHFGRPLPRWLQSGLAEFYSSVRIAGSEVIIGAPVDHHVKFLSAHGMMDPKTFLDSQQSLYESTDMNDREKFFAHSWALTHLLFVNEHYRNSSTSFVAAVAGGATPEAAIHSVYDKTLKDIESDLRNHLLLRMFMGIRFTLERPDAVDKASAQQIDVNDADLALAELLGSLSGREPEARERYENLAGRLPHDPRPHVGLAYVLLRQRNSADARRELERAFSMGYDSGSAHYTYARLVRADSKAAQEHLQRAVTLNPRHFESWRLLAETVASQGKHDLAIEYLKTAVKLKPGDAPVWIVTAREYATIGHLQDAQQAIKMARDLAVTADEKRIIEQLDQQLAAQRNEPR